MTALEGQGWSLLIFCVRRRTSGAQCTKHWHMANSSEAAEANNFCSREQQRRNKQCGPQLFWSLLFCDFVIKRMGSDLQTMDSWFISTAGPCGRCSFFSQRHMQIPTVPPLSLHNCRLFSNRRRPICVCICIRECLCVQPLLLSGSSLISRDK